VGINERDGVSGAGSGGSGGGGGGGGGSSNEPLDAATAAGGTTLETSDAAGATPECGAEGEACCASAPRCDLGLGCDVGSNLCAPCAAFKGVSRLQSDVASAVNGISGDGQVVVGYSEGPTGLTRAFRNVWASAEGPVSLSVLPGGASSSATGASEDGYAVVGESDSADGQRAFRWTPELGMLSLGVLNTDHVSSRARGVSADGNVVVGTSVEPGGNNVAFRWTVAGLLPIGGNVTEAWDVSADGASVAGDGLGGLGNEAVRSIALGTAEFLGALAGSSASFGRAISASGEVVVGISNSCSCGFRWEGAVADISLGLARALDTNLDGSVIGGDISPATCSGGGAAIWRSGSGAAAVACELLPAGLIPNGWALTLVTAVSDDGRVIAGEGINPTAALEGWVAVLGPDCRNP
jgi:probable HAF family extracellular repeat protein